MSRGRLLRRAQRVAGQLLALTAVLLLANSLFLYITVLPDGIVALVVRSHVWLGFGLTALLAVYAVVHWMLKRPHRNARAKRVGYGLLGLMALGSAAGVLLYLLGKSSQTAWLVGLHELAFAAALGAYLAHRLAAYVRPPLRYEAGAAVLVGVLALTLYGVNRGWTTEQLADALPVEAAPADYGLSRARTASGHWLDEDDLGNPAYCGQCHEQIYEQWSGSAHRFSSLNDPFYFATLQALQAHRPPDEVKFCAGCHDPTILLTGNAETPLDHDTPNADAGITCLTCHSTQRVRDRVGNAGYVVAAPEQYPYFDSDDPDEQALNRRLIRSRPEKHRASLMRPETHRTSEFCLSCHKTHLPEALNSYKWKRGINDFDDWQMSAASGQAALPFYERPERERCQDCHMPEVPNPDDPAADDGHTPDHTWPGANTALATVKDKPEWLRKTEDILRDSVTIDVFSAAIGSSDEAVTRVWPLDDPAARLPAGATARIEVVVHNKDVGHLFPTGTADLQEPWLELTVARPGQAPLAASGWLDGERRLDPAAHRFDTVLLTREGELVDIHNVEDFYTTLYNNAIPLGASDVVRYALDVPTALVGAQLEITARVRYRKFRREYTEFALGADAPALPIVDMAVDRVTVTVGSEAVSPGGDGPNPSLARRINDFGIAHLRQGDTGVAGWAFGHAAALDPDDANPHVNQARVNLAEGQLDVLEDALKEADQRSPGLAKTAYFLGRLRTAQGRFDEAIAAYDRALEQFPRDREVLNQKGTALFKADRFEAAIEVFEQVLAIDPENVAANTYLFRCYSALGDEVRARQYEVRYLTYRDDRIETNVTDAYRRSHPNADREANPRHVHTLQPPPSDAVSSLPRRSPHPER